MPKITFDLWKERLDNILSNVLGGLISDDLEDAPYYDWWEEGIMPSEAVDRLLKRHYDGLL
jgi:hypothetical protein